MCHLAQCGAILGAIVARAPHLAPWLIPVGAALIYLVSLSTILVQESNEPKLLVVAFFALSLLAGLVIKLTNSRSKIVYKAIPPDDPRQRKPDTSLAERVLGWKATTPLEVGLQHTIDYFDALLREMSQQKAPRA